ncbi:hypothetical protein OG439_27355 [Amycolatopsis sp. NBC_01307]|uniref:hypothetical protein n=1 Tax=Amycolatopsis sp. NBC_01307 TaxID=2903561 RepID=UPI002E157ED0|nr:hypothetical protein OG439_27355 [Amycolatopsis sp. NBC_01307]
MYVPQRLSDRLVIVARDDYVQVADDKPGLIQDDRVTLVPVPLLGLWTQFQELNGLDLSVGDAFVRDPDDPGRYVPVSEAPNRTAQRRLRLLRTVCQHLGATSLAIRQFDARSAQTKWGNDLTADVRDTLAHGKDKLSESRGLSTNLAWQSEDQLRLEIEAVGRWQGGPADIDAARKAVAAHGLAVDPDILTLIDQRSVQGNQLTTHQVTIDFRHEVTKHFSLIAELTAGFEATIGKQTLSAAGKLRNVFDWNQQIARHGHFTLEVSFGVKE